MNPHSIYPANDLLGEGPVWSSNEQAIYWVDIIKCRLQYWQPESNTYKSWTLKSEIGSYALREQGGAIVALKTGFAFLDFDSGETTALFDPEESLSENRFNDGKCDRQGRFWAGTIGANDSDTGALYRFDTKGNCQTMRKHVKVSNGLGWSPDNKTMYYTDSPLQKIVAFDFDETTGNLSNERVFAEINNGFPDGLTVDSEGYVWSAVWDGWRVERFAPDGSLSETIKMPVQRPTSCMFGGKNLDELFVTSASVGLNEKDLEAQPNAGNVFKIQTQTKGIPEPMYKG